VKGLINKNDTNQFMQDFFHKSGIVVALRSKLKDHVRVSMKSKIKAKKSKKVKKIKDGDDLLDGPEDEERNPSDDSSSDDEVTK